MKAALTVPALPSVTVTSLIESVGGGSSSVIVPTPWASAIVALAGLVRLTRNVSLVSSSRSPLTETVIVCVVWPGAKVRSPPRPGSRRAPAVPSAVAESTVTVWPLARQADGEGRVDGAGVALGHGHVVDRQGRRRVVVGDRADALAVGDRGVDRLGQVDEEGLVDLVEHVALDLDGEGLGGLAGGEDERAAGGGVVAGRMAVPLAVAESTVTVWPLGALRLTVKVALIVPALPSVTVTSLIERVGGRRRR